MNKKVITLSFALVLGACSTTTKNIGGKTNQPGQIKPARESFATAEYGTREENVIMSSVVGRAQIPYSDLQALPTSTKSSSFSYGDDPLQFVSVWNAKKTAGNENRTDQAVIFVHGGCWLNAFDLTHAEGFYHALSERGVGVYAVEYRRTGDKGGGWPGSAMDVSLAIDASLKHIAKEKRYQQVSVVGHSAGGHLALLAGQTVNPPQGVSLNTIIGLAAITDVKKYALGSNSCQTATPHFMGGEPKELADEYKNATPHAADIAFSILLMQGTSDSIVPVEHAFMSGATTITVENGGHFDWLHPDSTSFNALFEVLSKNDE